MLMLATTTIGYANLLAQDSGIVRAFNRFWQFELFRYQDNPITTGKIILSLLLLIIGGWLARRLSGVLGRRILPQVGVNNTSSIAFQRVLFYLLLFALALIALNILEVPLTVFTVLGGAIAIGVGFGAQAIVNNFISGWILLAERRVNIGDLIQVSDSVGHVRSIGARCTHVRRADGIDLLIPNSQMLEQMVINWTLTDNHVRTTVRVGVIYGSPTQKVIALIRSTVTENDRVLKSPAPEVAFEDFGDNALIFDVYFWVRAFDEGELRRVRSEIRITLDRLFRAEGIEIAFPQRDMHLRSKTPLDVRMLPTESEQDRERARIDDADTFTPKCSPALLRSVSLLRSLDAGELAEIANAASARGFSAGEHIVEQDQPGDSLFIVGTGMLKVTAKKGSVDTKLGQILPGDFFGEMSLLTGEPRRATVTALTDSIVYEIGHALMEPILKNRPDIARQLSDVLATRQRQLDQHIASASTTRQPQARLGSELRSRVFSFFGIRDD